MTGWSSALLLIDAAVQADDPVRAVDASVALWREPLVESGFRAARSWRSPWRRTAGARRCG